MIAVNFKLNVIEGSFSGFQHFEHVNIQGTKRSLKVTKGH